MSISDVIKTKFIEEFTAISAGGMAIALQNRAVYPCGFMPFGLQMVWQTQHGGLSGLLALGMTWMLC